MGQRHPKIRGMKRKPEAVLLAPNSGLYGCWKTTSPHKLGVSEIVLWTLTSVRSTVMHRASVGSVNLR